MYNNYDDDIITVETLCELLMIGKTYAYKLLNSSQIRAFRVGKHWKIPRRSVYEFIAKQSGFHSN